jgi:ArsR family transcriptional regulator
MTRAKMHSIARALSDPRRFEILKRIADQERAACAGLLDKFPITAATLSHHLKELQSCRLIEPIRRGKCIDLKFRRSVWDAYLKELNKI